MATLEEQLDNLRQIKSSGASMVEHEGRRIGYRTMAELNIAIADLEAQIAAQSGRARPVARRAVFRRQGW